MAQQWIYYFGDLGAKEKDLLGGKGANLSEMTKLGLPIPSGFIISTKACVKYSATQKWPQGLEQELTTNMNKLEAKSGKKFGDASNPLLVSVRSGAKMSMPGMMDTVLNLGLNTNILKHLSKTKGDRFAQDSWRRFITMYADVVVGVKREKFEHLLDKLKEEEKAAQDTDLSAAALTRLNAQYLELFKKETGSSFPMDPKTQLVQAINAVFRSWDNNRAKVYRKMHRIPDDIGTAVNIQEMVFGNMGDDCATGVAFTRNPSTGENKRYGEFLPNAQGEDVVAGIRTPYKIEEMKKQFPKCSDELYKIFTFLENHFKDMQDIEFTIERNKLFILQTRNGKRTAAAAVKMAVDMVNEGMIDKKEGVLRVDPESIDALLHKQMDPKGKKQAKLLGKGLPASPGAAVGQVVFSAEEAVAQQEKKIKTILVRLETSPEDITGMKVAEGILTARGGMTSHAAVVARGMNRCCVAGCPDMQVNEKQGYFTIKNKRINRGEFISLDGNTGEVFAGQVKVIDAILSGEFQTLLTWADSFKHLEIHGNCDTPLDAKTAREFGATGIGLCRTEHMFFSEERILAVREMILADTLEQRQLALDKLLPFQRDDFHGILGAMSGFPTIIRLLDPPLHEFLPTEEKDLKQLSSTLGRDYADIKGKVDSLHEFNPMLGFRGCRLGIVFPEINAMQIRAIFEASLQLQKEGKKPRPLIEIPLVGTVKEFLPLKHLAQKIAKETGAEGVVHYEIGTMIEVPRAALTADELAKEAQFMSFGTNDLTQMTCGFSRDDSARFLKPYVEQNLYPQDPFQSIDETGVGKLMQVCVTLARQVNPKIEIGICGEHGGEPHSVMFCHRIGLNAVSCSPFRVPVARMAAAHAAIKFGKHKPTTINNIFLGKSKL